MQAAPPAILESCDVALTPTCCRLGTDESKQLVVSFKAMTLEDTQGALYLTLTCWRLGKMLQTRFFATLQLVGVRVRFPLSLQVSKLQHLGLQGEFPTINTSWDNSYSWVLGMASLKQ